MVTSGSLRGSRGVLEVSQEASGVVQRRFRVFQLVSGVFRNVPEILRGFMDVPGRGVPRGFRGSLEHSRSVPRRF